MYFLVDAKTAGYPTKNIPNYTPFPLPFKRKARHKEACGCKYFGKTVAVPFKVRRRKSSSRGVMPGMFFVGKILFFKEL
jgi:hypothetical protein